ncbi:hypothetical protein AC579_7294 [Pseudocercospora musae]|uniref:Uncharacterized protein n=1 Tax=Pseudocercospora musae TaxID=113226 RepID=A0A139I363_9PEZI|nr:hypothetical protein AC579_7294 [Pseudocercospora musae]
MEDFGTPTAAIAVQHDFSQTQSTHAHKGEMGPASTAGRTVQDEMMDFFDSGPSQMTASEREPLMDWTETPMNISSPDQDTGPLINTKIGISSPEEEPRTATKHANSGHAREHRDEYVRSSPPREVRPEDST